MLSSTSFSKGHKQSNSGRTHFKKSGTPWNKGKEFPEMKGNTYAKGRVPWNKGKKLPPPWNNGLGEPLPKCSVCGKGLKAASAKTCKKHKTFSEATRRKIGNASRGSKNWNWKGGYENVLWHNRQRRIRRLGAGGLHTQEEWVNLKAQYNWTCPACHRPEPQIILTVDHIVPLIKGGSDNIENIQPLCRSCNSKKNTKIHKYEQHD